MVDFIISISIGSIIGTAVGITLLGLSLAFNQLRRRKKGKK